MWTQKSPSPEPVVLATSVIQTVKTEGSVVWTVATASLKMKYVTEHVSVLMKVMNKIAYNALAAEYKGWMG